MTGPCSTTRAQRLIDEFEESAIDWEGGKYNIRHGIAGVLRRIADTDSQYGDMESFSGYAIPTRTLEDLADALEAPTLLDRAMAGDKQAARQFLHEAGFTDANGNLLPHLHPITETND